MTLLFCEQVRKYKPMAETWNYVDQGMMPGVSCTPSYEECLGLCWKFLDRQAKQSARDALMGRSSHATPVRPNKPVDHRTPVNAQQNDVYNPGVKGAGRVENSNSHGYINIAKGAEKAKGKGKDRSRSARSEADSKLCREKGWCFQFYKIWKL